MSLGSRLRHARKRKGYTQADVAERLGIDFTTISKYENDRSEPDNETLKKLAELYDVSVSYLLGVDDNREEHTVTPEQAEFIEWVEKNLKGVFFHEFSGSPDEMKEEAMETLKLWWEMEKRRAERRKKRDRDKE